MHKDSVWCRADPITPRWLVGISGRPARGPRGGAPGPRVGTRSQALGLPCAATGIRAGHGVPFETQFPHLHKWEKDHAQALLTTLGATDRLRGAAAGWDHQGRAGQTPGEGPRPALPFPSPDAGSRRPSPCNTHPAIAGRLLSSPSLGCPLLREPPGHLTFVSCLQVCFVDGQHPSAERKPHRGRSRGCSELAPPSAGHLGVPTNERVTVPIPCQIVSSPKGTKMLFPRSPRQSRWGGG